MSLAASRESRITRALCRHCQDRKARFRHRGRVRADRHHVLCFQCFRAERERQRAHGLAGAPPEAPPAPSPFGRQLTDRQVAHRWAMLAHLKRAR